jgi:hypothetical protein
MDEWGIDGGVNLSGMYPGPPHNALQIQLAAAEKSNGRIAVFANADFRLVRVHGKDYGHAMAEMLEESRRLGAIGLKIPKGLGLGYPTADRRHLLPVDDPGLDPLFEKAGALGMPIAIHIGDPKAFWKPATPDNERWDELQAHPEWSFYGEPVPSWEQLYDAFERRVARHPKSKFIAVHFGNDPEDPERVAQMLDRYPNMYIDTAARVPEIGRQPAHARRRGPLLHPDLALLRDPRPPVREPDPHPGPLEDRRRRAARADPAQGLLRQRRQAAALAPESVIYPGTLKGSRTPTLAPAGKARVCWGQASFRRCGKSPSPHVQLD